jgi:polar amino acid transport system substrate-binding protein
MVDMHSLSDKKNYLFASQIVRNLILSFLIGIAFFSMTGCSSNNSNPELHIGQDSRWPTVNLMGKEPNFNAFNTDLLAAIAKKEKLRIHLVSVSATELLPELEQGKLKGILTNLKPDYTNEKRLLFSDIYFPTGPVLITSLIPREGRNEMAKKIIGVQSHPPLHLGLEKDPDIQMKIYDDILKALADLRAGSIDGVIFAALPAHIYTRTFYRGELKVVTGPLNDDGVRFVTLNNEEGQTLISQFNAGLEALKKEGTYDKLIDQWGLINAEKEFESKPSAISKEV